MRLAALLGPTAVAFGLTAAGLALPRSAAAFSEPRSYFDDSANGGGGGRWFTGSPAEGYGCSVCHGGYAGQPLYVEGLPAGGYVPAQTYDVRLSWPEYAALAHAIRQTPGAEPPSMGVVAELVAESGQGSGTIEIAAPRNAQPGELCEVPAGAAASQLYGVKPGRPTVEGLARCEANALEQRCLLAVLACGASELRFRWTAPAQWQGPIWFSAGFVATNRISGGPEADAVTEVTHVLRPAAPATKSYETELGGGCRVGDHRAARVPWLALGALLWLRRRGTRATALTRG